MQAAKYVKNLEPAPIQGFFHGIDVATQNDYYVDVIHVLTTKPKLSKFQSTPDRPIWLPYLASMFRKNHEAPDKMLDYQIKLFNKFPPTIAVIDSSREEFLSNALLRKYGESRIIPLKFMNTGSSNTKFTLKQLGFAYLDAGYEFPEIEQVEKTHPRFAKEIRILKKEMLHEQVEYTNTGKVSFNHPVGKHNDTVQAWEMSLKAVMEHQQRNLGYEKMHNNRQEFRTIQDDIYKDYPTEEEEPDIYDKISSATALPDERSI